MLFVYLSINLTEICFFLEWQCICWCELSSAHSRSRRQRRSSADKIDACANPRSIWPQGEDRWISRARSDRMDRSKAELATWRSSESCRIFNFATGECRSARASHRWKKKEILEGALQLCYAWGSFTKIPCGFQIQSSSHQQGLLRSSLM